MNAETMDVDRDSATIDEHVACGPEESQVCTGCWQRFPAHYFRRRSKVTGERHVRCNRCFNEQRRTLTAKKRAARIGEFAQYVNNNRDGRGRIEATLCEITRVFGGIQQFVGYWKEAIESAAAARKHHLVVRHLLAIANMGLASAQAVATPPSTEDLTDEELNHTVDEHLRQLVAQNPEIALRAARSLGWQVIPPDGNSAAATSEFS